jgi:hypothetical protein
MRLLEPGILHTRCQQRAPWTCQAPSGRVRPPVDVSGPQRTCQVPSGRVRPPVDVSGPSGRVRPPALRTRYGLVV